MADHELSWIDEQLRDVAVPPEALGRLREIATLGDRELDHLMRDVPAPGGMFERLHAIGAGVDTDVDDSLQEVTLPGGLIARLRKSVRWQAWRTRAAQVAIAASLMIAIGGSLYLLVSSMAPPGAPVAPNQFANHDGGQRVQDGHLPDGLRPRPDKIVHVTPDNNILPKPPIGPDVVVQPLPVHPEPNGPDLKPRPIDDDASNSDILTQLYANPPDLKVVPSPEPRGILGPRVHGYDLAFELKNGVHAPVQPGRNPLLRESRAPIWTGSASYEAALLAAQKHQPLLNSQIRVEDFLAAMDYHFAPAPPGQLALRTAAGPNPFASDNSAHGLSAGLLQLGVQAGSFPRGLDGGVHLTLAIDASTDMLSADRWAVVRSAIADIAERMSPKDRLSVVAFDGQAAVIAHDADRDTIIRDTLLKLDDVSPRGVADVATGLELAAALAQAKPADDDDAQPPPTHRLALVTCGLAPVSAADMARAKSIVSKAMAAGVQWQVIDVRPDVLPSAQLSELAAVSSADIRHAPTLHDLETVLHVAIAGRKQTVAQNIQLKITFDPDAVESYRLVGHEATLIGLEPGQLEGELRADEAATVLYAVELKADGPDEIGTVELTWREPGSEEIHRVKQPVGRLQFAPTWLEAPLPLQTAALAAQTAEVLRGSYNVPNPARSLDQLAELARSANPALQSRAAFMSLRSLIEAARASRSFGASRGT